MYHFFHFSVSLCLRSACISLALILKGFSAIESYVNFCVRFLNVQEEQVCAENT